MLDRRRFAAALAGLAALPSLGHAHGLASLTAGAIPISNAERAGRVAKLQSLMRRKGVAAVLVEPGASLVYFTGLRWGRSERLTAALIPAEGEPMIVTPAFEELSVRERLPAALPIRTWQEHESPFALVAQALTGRTGDIAVEETVRHFAVDGLQRAAPDRAVVSGADLVRACRMIKSPAELALMQLATDVTLAAYRHTYDNLRPGMTAAEVSRLMNEATRALGGEPEFALVLIGEASAYPHGGGRPQTVAEGQIILMDCGCAVHGYQSDVSRTFVLGQATAEQRRVFDHVQQGQEIALAAAGLGRPAGAVDDAVRRFYQGLGYGPDYRLPGLSHRTGHGIGLDGHEPVNLVRGEATPMTAGMCFSNEPGLYFPGRFGVRLEDCFHMTEAGPRYFSSPQRSIERPVG